MQVLGVDFSGAKTDDRTWAAAGAMEGNELALQDCRPVRRAELAELLSSLPGASVAALDFPFSVPGDFARFWQPGAATMPDLWAAAASMELDRFVDLRDEFVARHGESKRHCDLRFPECYSCLHKANPNMVPMTFYGMRMLGPLWRGGCAVLPLASRNAGKAVLLEAMPGAALKAMKLPYKGYKKGANALRLRQTILEGLEERSGLRLQGLGRFRDACLSSDDALDAVVAAVIAALWAKDPGVFLRPEVEEAGAPHAAALLEGWLYAPVFLDSPSG